MTEPSLSDPVAAVPRPADGRVVGPAVGRRRASRRP